MRKTVPLHPRFDDDLDSYVTAAKANVRPSFASAAAITAVGLASLSVAPALNAEIVYTPANQVMYRARTGSSQLPLDLNHDGQVDFNLRLLFETSFSSSRATAGGFILASGNGVSNRAMVTSKSGYESALPLGAAIGSRGRFGHGTPAMASCADFFSRGSFFSGGPWRNVTNRYLGLRFLINGETHYGWARLSVTSGCRYRVTLTGYAYETVPDKPIDTGVFETAPEESSNAPARRETLGELAMGVTRRR